MGGADYLQLQNDRRLKPGKFHERRLRHRLLHAPGHLPRRRRHRARHAGGRGRLHARQRAGLARGPAGRLGRRGGEALRRRELRAAHERGVRPGRHDRRAAALRLPRRAPARLRDRPAPQPREVRHCRVVPLRFCARLWYNGSRGQAPLALSNLAKIARFSQGQFQKIMP